MCLLCSGLLGFNFFPTRRSHLTHACCGFLLLLCINNFFLLLLASLLQLGCRNVDRATWSTTPSLSNATLLALACASLLGVHGGEKIENYLPAGLPGILFSVVWPRRRKLSKSKNSCILQRS